MKSKDRLLLETVVCSAQSGVSARLQRLLDARQALRRRTEGCLKAWACKSLDGQSMFLIQAVYENEEAWRRSAKRVENELDTRDGGIESLLGGPPLVGMFAISRKDLE